MDKNWVTLLKLRLSEFETNLKSGLSEFIKLTLWYKYLNLVISTIYYELNIIYYFVNYLLLCVWNIVKAVDILNIETDFVSL